MMPRRPSSAVQPAPEAPSQAALRRAARDGDLPALREALGRGADPRAKDLDGWDATMLAAAEGRGECLRELLEAGIPDPEELLAPMKLAGRFGRFGRLECAEMLAQAVDASSERELRAAGFEAAIEAGRDGCAYAIAGRGMEIGERRHATDEAGQIAAASAIPDQAGPEGRGRRI